MLLIYLDVLFQVYKDYAVWGVDFFFVLTGKKVLFLKETLENRVKRTLLGNIEDGSTLFAQVTNL